MVEDAKNSITASKDKILKTVIKNITTDTEFKMTCMEKEVDVNCKTDLLAKEKTDEGVSISNDILNTDIDLNEMFIRLYDETSATVSDKENVKSLPGLSYIIIFTSTKMKQSLLTFDCVLCNPSVGRILSSRILKNHLRSKSHLLNILKLHDYSLFTRYKDLSAVTHDDLRSEASNCEVNTEKEIIFAIARTYSDKRKQICSTIARLSEHSMKIYESKHPIEIIDLVDDDDEEEENVFSKLQKFSSPVLNFLNSDNQAPAKQLVKKQKDRYPKRIVFVVDDDIPFKAKQFGELVTVARIDDLNFLNAVQKFKDHNLLGKGSLFIISCGIYSLLSASIVDICKLKNCPKPLKNYSVDCSMTSDILMSKALELQAYILTNTTDDQVLFCDIIPINISKRVIKKCENKHSLRHDTLQDIYINYLNIIEEYNKFVDIHCELFGFKNLNLLNMSFPLDSNNVPRSLNYLYDYNQVDTERVSDSINEYLYELLKKIGIKIEDIPVVSTSTTVRTTLASVSSVPLKTSTIPVRITMASSSITASVSSVAPKTSTIPADKSEKTTRKSDAKVFTRVIIITNPQYSIYMENFKGPKVEIICASLNNVSNIAGVVKQYCHRQNVESCKILWLSHADMFKFSRTEDSPMCSSCGKVLKIIVPDKQHLAMFEDHVTGIQGSFEALSKEVNSFLNSDSAFVILPPVPLTLLVLDNIKHYLCHKIDGRRKLCHFTTAGALTEFQSFYSKLSKQMIAFSLSEFTKRNITMHPLADYARIVDSWNSYLDVVTYEDILKLPKDIITKKYYQWFDRIYQIILKSLKFDIKKNSAAEPVKSQKKENNRLEEENNIKPDTVTPNTLNISPKTRVRTIPHNYHHIILICFCQEHSNFLSRRERNAKNISVLLMNNTLDCTEMKKEFEVLLSHDCNKILFVIIGSMYLLGSEFCDSFCYEDCTEPLYYTELESIDLKDIVKNTMQKLKHFVLTLQMLFRDRSRVIFTPLLNTKYAFKPFIWDALQHESVHKSIVNANYPCLAVGQGNRWLRLPECFQDSWYNEMYLQFHDQLDEEKVKNFKDIVRNFKKKCIPPLFWVDLQESSVGNNLFYNTECKLFLKEFLDVACPSPKNRRRKLRFCTRPVLQANTKIVSKARRSAQSYVNTNTEINISQKHHSGYKINNELSSSAFVKFPNTPNAVQENVNVPDSSECFYNNDWKDLVTFGSQSSLWYLVEAIKGLRQFPPHQKAKVLYISSASKLSIIKPLAFNKLSSTRESAINLAVLEEHSICADLYDVFMGTPHILANFHWDILRRNDIKALIVDDVMNVLATAEDRITLTSIFRRMHLSENSDVKKVFVTEFYQADIPQYLTSLFGIPLMEVQPPDSLPAADHGFQGQKNLVNIGYPGISSQMDSDYPTISSGYSNYPTISSQISGEYPTDNRVAGVYTAVSNVIESDYPTIRTHAANIHSAVTGQAGIGYPAVSSQQGSYSYSISELENQLTLQDSQHQSVYPTSSPKEYKSRSRSPTRNQESRSIARNQGSRLLSQNRRSRSSSRNLGSHSLSRNRGNRSLSRNRGSRSLSRNRGSRSVSSRSLSQYRRTVSYSMRRERSRSQSAMKGSHSRSQRRESRLNSREIGMQSRSGIRSCQSTSENILRVSQNPGSPSALPNKRLRSRSRSKDHRPLSRNKRFRSRSPSENYRSLLQGKRFCSRSRSKSRSISRSKSRDTIQGRFYVSERNSRHDSMASESTSHDSQSSGQESSSTIHNFSVAGALNLLQKVSHKLGMLGTILETLSNTIKLELESNRNKALNIIKEAENIIIFNMIVDKLKTLLLTASLDEISIISKSIEWTTHLMEYAKKNSQQEVNINIRAIAAASMNQIPSFTLNLIKTAFVYEGKENPTTEEINAMFLQVCSLHFEMAVEDN